MLYSIEIAQEVYCHDIYQDYVSLKREYELIFLIVCTDN